MLTALVSLQIASTKPLCIKIIFLKLQQSYSCLYVDMFSCIDQYTFTICTTPGSQGWSPKWLCLLCASHRANMSTYCIAVNFRGRKLSRIRRR